MPPLADQKAGSRQRRYHAGAPAPREPLAQRSASFHGRGSAGHLQPPPREPLAQRSASFHGRGSAEHLQQREDLLRRRPRTHPDLLAGVRGLRRPGADAGGDTWGGRAAPSKVLVTVAVHRSMWPLHVMARADWRVADLVAAVVQLYVGEGRRPLLPATDPGAFGLHYSQFSLQSLDPDAKLMELRSRSFFLCPKPAATADAASSSACSSAQASKATATTPANKPNMLPPWLGFVHFWPLL